MGVDLTGLRAAREVRGHGGGRSLTEHPAVGPALASASEAALAWLDAHHARADPWRDDGLDAEALQAFAEYTILADRIVNTRGGSSGLPRRCLQSAQRWQEWSRSTVSSEDYASVVRKRPLQAFMYVLPYLVLRRRGFRGVAMEDSIDWLLRRRLVVAPEVTAFRELDLTYFFTEAGYTVPGPSLEDLMRATAAFRLPGAEYLDASAAYSLTHTVFYISDFGRRPIPCGKAEAAYLIDLLDTSVVQFWRSGHWDLMGESLLGLAEMQANSELSDRATLALLDQQRSDGSVPGGSNGAPPSGEAGVFSANYHTTLVLGLLGAVATDRAES